MFAILRIKILGYKNQIPLLLGFIGMMLIFTYIFGASFSSKTTKPTVYIVDNINDNTSNLLIRKLQESETINLEQVGYDKAVDNVERSKGIGAIIIEKDTQEIKLSLMSINETRDIIVLKNVILGVTRILQNDIKLADITYKYLDESGIAVGEEKFRQEVIKEISELRNEKTFYKTSSKFINTQKYSYDSLKQSLAGFSLFFSMFVVFFGIGDIVDEKRCYVWQRQLVSPIKKSSMLSGNMIATFIVGFTNILVMVYSGKYLFHIDWGKSHVGVLLLLGTFIFAVTCLGLFIASFFKTRQQLSSIVPVITVSTSMLGGCMWPLEIIQSKALLFIANLTPQKWALEGIKDLIMYGQGIESIVTPVLVLLLMGIIYLALGIRFINISK